MTFSVNFLERREGDSPSIERVFRSVAANLNDAGITTRFTKAAYGNSFGATLANLAFFRPAPADIFHVTGHISFMALVLPKRKTVLTFHDLTILEHRTGLRRWLIKWIYFILPARRARFLTAISEATKARLVHTAGIATDKVTVIENPLLVARSSGHDFNWDRPTILQLGTAPNKNVDRLIEALKGVPCRLRIVGPLSSAQKVRLTELEIDVTNEEFLNDEQVELAYEGADIVTLCSTDEGFGLPIIEGQAKDKIVVTSGRSPMGDVAGAGAVLVDPERVESIRDGILEAIKDPDLRARLFSEGRKNIERFGPKEIAVRYLTLYKRVVAENKDL
jgi:glycosyltransferase involved in cell wall biosynthesis